MKSRKSWVEESDVMSHEIVEKLIVLEQAPGYARIVCNSHLAGLTLKPLPRTIPMPI